MSFSSTEQQGAQKFDIGQFANFNPAQAVFFEACAKASLC